MAKKSNIVESEKTKFHLFSTVGGVITTLTGVAAFAFGIGWWLGERNAKEDYKAQIEDYKFEKLQMQLDFQAKLQEEKEKWESNKKRDLTIDELTTFLTNFKEFQLKENEKASNNK